jgi:hypothetical protein
MGGREGGVQLSAVRRKIPPNSKEIVISKY